MSKEETQLLAKLKKRAKAAYGKLKETEAKAGGRTLPLGLEDGVAQITGMKIGEDKQERIYVYLYSNVLEPESCKGIPNGFYMPLEEDAYNSEEENQAKLIVALKLLGYEELVLQHNDIFTLLSDVGERLEQDKPVYLFSTGRKARKNGDVICFIQGLPEEGYVAPETEEPNTSPETHKPAAKKKVTPKPEPFPEGTKVKTTNNHFDDGKDYTGTVLGFDGTSVSVEFDDDGSTLEVPPENLVALDPPKKPTPTKKAAPKKGLPTKEEPTFEAGDVIISQNDHFENGEDYTGTIVSISDDIATVEWSDGETSDAPIANIKLAE